MKINIKAFVLLAMVLSVVVISGCAQQPAQNQTAGTSPAASATPVKIESTEEANKAVVDTSKDVKKISDTLAGIDKALGGK